MEQSQTPSTPYDVVDLFRAIAAYVVLISHVRHLMVAEIAHNGPVNWAINFALSLGQDAVIVFFVISGFWIIRGIVRVGGSFRWSPYLIARLSRLWLVLIPAIVIGGILDRVGIDVAAAGLYNGTQGNIAVEFDVASRLTWENFASSILFLQTLIGQPFGSNGPLWSLAYEFWYYVIFPCLWLAFRFKRFSLLILPSVGILFLFPMIIPGFAIWCLGGCVFLALERGYLHTFINKSSTYSVFISFILFFLSIFCKHAFDFRWSIGDFLVGATFSMLLLTVISTGFTLPRFLMIVSRFGSNGSFSLYVTHFPFIMLIAALIVPETRLPVGLISWLIVFALTIPPVLYAYVFALLTEHNTAKVRKYVSTLAGRAELLFSTRPEEQPPQS